MPLDDTPKVKVEGQPRQFATGAVRNTAKGKGRFDLLPMLALREVAKVCEQGAAIYGPRNVEKGIPLSSFIDSAFRHIACVMEGMVDEPHAAQAAWNMLMFCQIREMIRRGLLPAELDDLPDYTPRMQQLLDAMPSIEVHHDHRIPACSGPDAPLRVPCPVPFPVDAQDGQDVRGQDLRPA